MNNDLNKVAVVGAGFTGAIIANELAKAGYVVDVYDRRSHVGGNCRTYRDSYTGILVHVYGPHIFHTSNEKVWKYITQWDEFIPYIQRTKAVVNGIVYSMPINLHTINQYFAANMSPVEVRAYIQKRITTVDPIVSFKDQALAFVGVDLYEAFLKGYTEKQWGVPPKELPASILKRLPLRFDYNDNYFNDTYQAMPAHGYSYIIEKMLNHPRIRVRLGADFHRPISDCSHIFYSGTLDGWFGYSLGRLGYRSLRFEEEYGPGDYQGCAVMNYCDASVPWTRITEFKHFEPWAEFDNTITFKEFSYATGPEDEPFYPLRLVNDKKLLTDYISLAEKERDVTFVGRLGTYRYLDMHQAIAEALEAAETFIRCRKVHSRMLSFLGSFYAKS